MRKISSCPNSSVSDCVRLMLFDVFWRFLTYFDAFCHFCEFWHFLTLFDTFLLTFFDTFWRILTIIDAFWLKPLFTTIFLIYFDGFWYFLMLSKTLRFWRILTLYDAFCLTKYLVLMTHFDTFLHNMTLFDVFWCFLVRKLF